MQVADYTPLEKYANACNVLDKIVQAYGTVPADTVLHRANSTIYKAIAYIYDNYTDGYKRQAVRYVIVDVNALCAVRACVGILAVRATFGTALGCALTFEVGQVAYRPDLLQT